MPKLTIRFKMSHLHQSFRLLIFQPPSSQFWAEKGFKPKHGILRQALSCTPTGYAPGIPALLLNLTKMGIPDGQLWGEFSHLIRFALRRGGIVAFAPRWPMDS